MYQQNKQSYNDILAIAEVPSQSNGKRTNYSVNSAGTVSYPYEKKKSDSYLTLYTKINSRRSKDRNLKTITIKF